MNSKTVLLTVLLFCLVGCEEDVPQRARILPLQLDVEDPAMQLADKNKDELIEDEAGEKILYIREEPTQFSVDFAGQRVFLPDRGWVSTRRFWEIYYQQPEKLPGELDFELIEQLKKITPPEQT